MDGNIHRQLHNSFSQRWINNIQLDCLFVEKCHSTHYHPKILPCSLTCYYSVGSIRYLRSSRFMLLRRAHIPELASTELLSWNDVDWTTKMMLTHWSAVIQIICIDRNSTKNIFLVSVCLKGCPAPPWRRSPSGGKDNISKEIHILQHSNFTIYL